MYAVIESGGKQHRVSVGDRLRVESLGAEPGAELELDRVLLVADGDDVAVGAPHVSGKPVVARVLGHGRGDKIRVFKFKRRKGYERTLGHRQNYTELEIVSIAGHGTGGGATKAKRATKKKAPAKKATPKADTAATGSDGGAEAPAEKE